MSKKIDVFIIDDDPQSTQYFQAILNKSQTIRCIGSTSSAEKAVETIVTAYPDVILLDYALYPISGFDMIGCIQQELPHTPIILLGGRSALCERALACGAKAYLPKPITPRILLDTIHDVHAAAHSIAPQEGKTM